jgi:hypothetical protein
MIFPALGGFTPSMPPEKIGLPANVSAIPMTEPTASALAVTRNKAEVISAGPTPNPARIANSLVRSVSR